MATSNSLLSEVEFSDVLVTADNPRCNENDKFRCTGSSDTSRRLSETIAALARPSYAPSRVT